MPADYVQSTTEFSTSEKSGIGKNSILLIGKSNIATSGYGVLKEINTPAQAAAEYGTSDSVGAELINMIDACFRVGKKAPERVFCVSVGKHTLSGVTATTSEDSVVGSSLFTVGSDVVSDFPTGAVFTATGTGIQEIVFTVKTSVLTGGVTTITVSDNELIPTTYPSGATLSIVDMAAQNTPTATTYEEALATAVAASPTAGGDTKYVVVDTNDKLVLAKLKAHCEDSTVNEERGRIGFYGAGTTNVSVQDILGTANDQTISSDLVSSFAAGIVLDKDGLIMSSAEYTADVVASIAGELDPAIPIHGTKITGATGQLKIFKKSDLNVLEEGGVTALYTMSNGDVVIHSGVTTYTGDARPKDLNVSNIAIYVEQELRTLAEENFGRRKATKRVRAEVENSMKLKLNSLVEREIIEGVEGKTYTLNVQFRETDSTRLDVTVDYWPVRAIRQITITPNLHLS